MIKNARQYGASKKQMAKLQEALELSIKYPAEMDPRIYDAMIAGIESQIQDVQQEIDEYDKLQKDKKIPVDKLGNIGQLLIKARIAAGYTQKQLAEKVNKKEQTIQRYESTEYQAVSLKRLIEIIEVLDVSALVELLKPQKFGENEISLEYKNVDIEEPKAEVEFQEINNSEWLIPKDFDWKVKKVKAA